VSNTIEVRKNNTLVAVVRLLRSENGLGRKAHVEYTGKVSSEERRHLEDIASAVIVVTDEDEHSHVISTGSPRHFGLLPSRFEAAGYTVREK
jgi:hypothetical protein